MTKKKESLPPSKTRGTGGRRQAPDNASTSKKKTPADSIKSTTRKTAGKKKPSPSNALDKNISASEIPSGFKRLGSSEAKYPNAHRLALVAAIVLKENDIDLAVKTALQIYDRSYTFLHEAEMEEAGYNRPLTEDEELECCGREEFPFNQAVKIITRETRLKRAIEYYQDYMIYTLETKFPHKTREERSEMIEKQLWLRNQEGFGVHEVIRIRHHFQKYFPKRRNKSLDTQNPL